MTEARIVEWFPAFCTSSSSLRGLSIWIHSEGTRATVKISTDKHLKHFISILHLSLSPFHRTSTKQSWIKRKCTSATFTSCMTCIWKRRITQVLKHDVNQKQFEDTVNRYILMTCSCVQRPHIHFCCTTSCWNGLRDPCGSFWVTRCRASGRGRSIYTSPSSRTLTVERSVFSAVLPVFVSRFFRFSSRGSSQPAIKLSVCDCISSSCPSELNGIYIISKLNRLITWWE